MATTVTVGAAGAGLAAAAVAGAVGLGLAGLAGLALAGGGRGRRKKHYGGYGYGGYGGHGGHGGHGGGYGGYGYHRKRRAADEDAPVEEDEIESALAEAESIERVLELVRAQDVTGCGRRLVCELGGADPGRLDIEELAILNLVGSGVRPGEGFVPPGASWEYRAARGYGETGGDCAKAFSKCPLNGPQLMEVVNQYIP